MIKKEIETVTENVKYVDLCKHRKKIHQKLVEIKVKRLRLYHQFHQLENQRLHNCFTSSSVFRWYNTDILEPIKFIESVQDPNQRIVIVFLSSDEMS